MHTFCKNTAPVCNNIFTALPSSEINLQTNICLRAMSRVTKTTQLS